MWATLCRWMEPHRQDSSPVSFRKCQRFVSPELREAELITNWPKDGLRHTWISSLLALGVSRDWVAELVGNSSGIIRTNYKHLLPEKNKIRAPSSNQEIKRVCRIQGLVAEREGATLSVGSTPAEAWQRGRRKLPWDRESVRVPSDRGR